MQDLDFSFEFITLQNNFYMHPNLKDTKLHSSYSNFLKLMSTMYIKHEPYLQLLITRHSFSFLFLFVIVFQ